MSSPTIEQLIEVVFKKLSLAYGRDFISKWEGLDMLDVKSDWCHELSGFERNPLAIKHALQNLPTSRAPNVFEFRAICQRAPEPAPAALLDSPRANPELVRRSMVAARAALTKARG